MSNRAETPRDTLHRSVRRLLRRWQAKARPSPAADFQSPAMSADGGTFRCHADPGPAHGLVRTRLPVVVLGAVLAAAAVPALAVSFREVGTPVEVAIYDFEVAIMCGLASATVQRGFHARLATLVRDAGLDRTAFEQARMRGWAAAEREWSNRGLGGFRGWCRDEGATAAAGFAAHDPGVTDAN